MDLSVLHKMIEEERFLSNNKVIASDAYLCYSVTLANNGNDDHDNDHHIMMI